MRPLIAIALLLIVSSRVRAQEDLGGIAIYQRVSPAVVQVSAFDRSGATAGRASGVILRDRNWLVTNRHAVDQGQDLIVMHDANMVPLDPMIVHADSVLDVLVFRIDTAKVGPWYHDIPLLSYTVDGRIQEGEPVYAIGNPYGFTNTISRGIVSGLRQDSVHHYIQTDAAFSPGNSGGALVNGRGELIGIPTWIYGERLAQNINFALPMEVVLGWAARERHVDLRLADPNDPLIAGSRAMRRKDYRAAINAFNRMENKQVLDWYRSLYFTGVAYERLGQPDSAAAAYMASLKFEPGFAKAHWRLSLHWLDHGFFEQAMEEQGKAYAIDPSLRWVDRRRY